MNKIIISLQFFIGLCFVNILICNTISAQVNYVPLITESGLNNYTTNTSLPVGSIAASGDVTNQSASYAVPIALPAGTGDAVPNLSISYNSFGGSDHLGFGWALNGLSSITRSLKTIYHDGTSDAVKLNSTDKFAIDGIRLIATAGVYSNNGTTYSKEMQDFSRITSYGNIGGGPEWFKRFKVCRRMADYFNFCTIVLC